MTEQLNWTELKVREVNSREGTQLHPSIENWIKDLLSIPPLRTISSFTLSQSPPSGSFHKPLIFSIRGQTDWKPQPENESIWSHGPQPCLSQWNYEPCQAGPPKMDGSWWRVQTKYGPLEKGMANHFSTLALRMPWTEWKGRKLRHWMINSPGL